MNFLLSTYIINLISVICLYSHMGPFRRRYIIKLSLTHEREIILLSFPLCFIRFFFFIHLEFFYGEYELYVQ